VLDPFVHQFSISPICLPVLCMSCVCQLLNKRIYDMMTMNRHWLESLLMSKPVCNGEVPFVWWQVVKTGHQQYKLLKLPSCSTSVRHKFSAARVAKIWNSQPSDSVDFSSLKRFKSSLNTDITIYDTRCYFNLRSKADMSPLNLPHGNDK